jgi:hypothetical protein
MFEGVAKLQAGRSSSLGNEEGKNPVNTTWSRLFNPTICCAKSFGRVLLSLQTKRWLFHPRIIVHHISFLTLLSSTFRGLPLSFQGYTRYSAEGNYIRDDILVGS